MQSSARQPISRTSSNRNNDISRTQEVSVTSLPRNFRPGINANVINPSNSLHNARSRSESGIRSLSSSLSPNPNVTQPRSRSSMGVPMGRPHLMRSQATEDRRRESQSMKELAEFLRTKEPPPNNWMSIPEPSERGRTAKRPLWLFQRKSSRKAAGQERQIRLPDSAVAAKTSGGHWHIAISIPNEHYPNDGQPGHDNRDMYLDSGGTQRHIVYNRNGTSTITVLKPVNEERPHAFRENSKKSFREAVSGPDTGFEAFHGPGPSSGALRPRVQNRQERNYIVVNPQEDQETTNFDRRHSGGTIYSVKSLDEGPSHAHSQSNLKSDNADLVEDKHGNRFIAIRGIEPPTRLTSIQQQFLSPELAAEASRPAYQSTSSNRGTPGHRHSLSAISNDQSVAESIDSNFSMGRISIADTAVPCGPSNKNRKSVTQNQPGPPPDRKLPNLPESSSDDGRTIKPISLASLPTPSAPTKESHAAEKQRPTSQPHPENRKSTDSGRRRIGHSVESSRRDRVKALRNRDMAAQISQAKLNGERSPTSAETDTTTTKTDLLQDQSLSSKPDSKTTSIASKRASRRAGSTSPPRRSSLEKKRGGNMLSSIMVVATIAPRCEYGIPRSAGSLNGSLAASNYNKTRRGPVAPTPPRSRAHSIASSDDENEDFNSAIPLDFPRQNLPRPNSTPFYQTHKRMTSTASAPQVSGTRKVTPPQKISKSVNHSPKASEDIAAVSIRTSDLETRLTRVEKSNRAMLQTVSAVLAVGKGLGDLGALLPAASGEPDILKDLGVGLNTANCKREELSSETSDADTVRKSPTPKRKIQVGSVAHARQEIMKMQRPVIQKKTEVEPTRKISRKAEEIEAVLKRLGMEIPSNLQGRQEEKRRNGSLREVEGLIRELRGASRVSLEGERSFDDSHDSLSEYY